MGLIAVGDSGGLGIDPRVFLILVAAMGGAVFIVLQKHYMKKYSPLEFTSYVIWAGTLMLLLFSGGLVEAVRLAPNGATAMVVYLGLFPAAVGYVLWARVLAVWTASKAASALFLVPALSLVISWAWLGEVPNLLGIVGGTLALTGVGVVRTSGYGVRIWGRPLRVPERCESGAWAMGLCGREPCACEVGGAPAR